MICRLTRWSLSSALDRRAPPPAWVARHLGRCAACRGAAARLTRLDAALFAAADEAPRPAALPAPAAAPAASLGWAIGGLASVALLLVVAAVVIERGESATTAGPPAPSALAPAAPAPAAPVPPDGPPLFARVLRAAETAHARAAALEHEANSLIADTRAGVRHALRVGGLVKD